MDPLDQDPPRQIPPKGTWDQEAKQEVTSYKDPFPPVNKKTDRCKNVTLRQTSFVGGNKYRRKVPCLSE